MKVLILFFFIAIVVFVECGHTFLGTSVQRRLIFHKDAKYPSKLFQKRIENINFTIPFSARQYSPSIQGILVYDLTHSGASANVTKGGLGYNFVNLRLKSDKAAELHYDIYIYA